ncbi:MAG: FkbM family methyltransferase [Calothrix sp. C42_A2020_038]|nr:FkbM family methyltransferase [Calothrix sp. C42_A2020_038]
MGNIIGNSELNRIIPAEIKYDDFYTAIQQLAKEKNIKTILEIGSSSGQGSTEAFVNGIIDNPNKPKLFCMEISKARFHELKKTYEKYDFVKCYNMSSVCLEDFPSEKEIIDFYNNTSTNLNLYPLEQVLNWLKQDIEYVKNSGVDDNGIQKIKQENNIIFFDLVLIDGSEFTGNVELNQVYGAKYILLDDINTFKNYINHQKLLNDENYTLICANYNLRNGYSIFQKINNYQNYYFSTEKPEQSLITRLIQPGMITFDVGANVGDYSILLSKLVGSLGKVYSFEATSTTFSQLNERLEQNQCTNVCSINKAVYSKDGEIEFNEFPEEFSVWNSIGKPQMLNPEGSGEYVAIAQTRIVETVSLDSFCKNHNIQNIDYLKIDVEGAEIDVLEGATSLLRNKAIKFIQFEISQKMLEGLSRAAKPSFDILNENGYECHRISSDGDIGEIVNDSNAFYENYIAFPILPINFFTIVLNGQPFIQYHIDVLKQLPFKWHWHIVEGVAELNHDTAWSVRLGGSITEKLHRNGRSCDGTTEYLDELARQYPENITIYRQPEGIFWDGKREMVNAPLANIQEECLLWQIDVDELWTTEQICTARQIFINNPSKTAAYYWCWYFVGEKLVISTRNCYTQNPQQEWLRTWKFKPGAFWAAHEPPVLVEKLPNNQLINVAAENPFLHNETEDNGLVFQHFAYVTEEQLRFKEQYYGYQNAVEQWKVLQQQTKFPLFLREYFSWVGDGTQVDSVNACGVVPIARKESQGNFWRFLQPDELQQQLAQIQKIAPIVIIDGVFFQLYQTGIARVWKSLLEEWANNGFARHIIVLDRAGTAPKISCIKYRTIPAYDYSDTNADREMLQQICDQEGADVFISSYYTTPLTTPSVFIAYDMIPEVFGWDFRNPMWQEKHYAIQHASSYIAISENTARDLVKYFADISQDSVTVAHCGVAKNFTPANDEEVHAFKTKYGIVKPYFILVGAGTGYKNSILFFQAFSQLASRFGFDVICTGSTSLAPEFRSYTSGCTVHMLQLNDEELAIAYSGAIALVYPSKYEGFGLPIVEAMASGCPVITCPNGSIPEVSGEAVIYVNDNDIEALAEALCEVQKPTVRNTLIAAGLEQVKQFSWLKMAESVSSVFIEVTLQPLNLKKINWIIFPDWLHSEEVLLDDLEKIIYKLAKHPESQYMTLLIDTSNSADNYAEFLLSAVTMNLMMQENTDISEGLNISFVSNLSDLQWQALQSRIRARIPLKHENKDALIQAKAEFIPQLNSEEQAFLELT